MSLVERNVLEVEEREKEIIAIIRSISEINEMYRDLATLIVDQVSQVLPAEVNLVSILVIL